MSDIYLEAESIMQICGMRNQYDDPATYSATKDAVVFAMRHYCESVEKSELNALREELHKCTNHAKECVNTPLMSQVLAERDTMRAAVGDRNKWADMYIEILDRNKQLANELHRLKQLNPEWTADMMKALERAVAERDKLREENFRLRTDMSKGWYTAEKEAEYERRYAESRQLAERYREALEKIMSNLGVPEPSYPFPVAHAYDIAKQALQEEKRG